LAKGFLEGAGTMDMKLNWNGMSLRNKSAAVIGCAVLLAVLIGGGKWLYYRFTHAITDDAFVESDLINVSPRVPGHIKELLVDESDSISKGQILALLDPSDYQAQVEMYEAKLDQIKKAVDVTRTTLQKTREMVAHDIAIADEGIRQSQATLEKARADYNQVQKDYPRIENLYKSKSVPKARFDLIQAQRDAAAAGVKAASAAVEAAKKAQQKAISAKLTVTELEKTLAAQEQSIKETEKALAIAQLNLEHTRIKSPVNGTVAKKFIFAGDYANPGYPIFSVYDTDNVFVRAHLEETKMKGVQLGQMVDLDVDAYPRKTFRGKVIKIGEASGAKFMLIPRDTTTGEFTKVVQRIPIKIAILNDTERVLKPGYSVTIGIKLN
jgi:membrane fusion protein (multidrug efflux system)